MRRHTNTKESNALLSNYNARDSRPILRLHEDRAFKLDRLPARPASARVNATGAPSTAQAPHHVSASDTTCGGRRAQSPLETQRHAYNPYARRQGRARGLAGSPADGLGHPSPVTATPSRSPLPSRYALRY